MDYDLIVVKTLERVYKNYYYIIRGEFLLALVKMITYFANMIAYSGILVNDYISVLLTLCDSIITNSTPMIQR